MTTRFYAIGLDWSMRPFATVFDAQKLNPALILEVKEHFKSGVDRDYEFVVWTKRMSQEGYQREGAIQVGSWKLINAQPVRSHFDTENIGFDVVDPGGLIKLKFFGKAVTEKGIIKAMEFLESVSKFRDWDDFDRLQRNDTLV